MQPRTVAIGVTALVVGVGLVAIFASGDSNDSGAAPAPSLAAVTQPDLSAIAADPGAATPPTQAGSQKGKQGAGAQGQASAATTDGRPTCPQEWSRAQCRAAGRAYQQALHNSHAVKDGQCPLPTKEMCEAAGRAHKQAVNGSHEVGPKECPLPTREMCEEAGRQNQQAGVNPFQ